MLADGLTARPAQRDVPVFQLNRTSFSYDATGQQVDVENPLVHRSTGVYNAAGQAFATVNPLGNRTTSIYDDDGQTIAINAWVNRCVPQCWCLWQ